MERHSSATLCVLFLKHLTRMVASCGKALYIDTENTFRASRIYQIAENRGYDPKEFLEGILILRAFESSELN